MYWAIHVRKSAYLGKVTVAFHPFYVYYFSVANMLGEGAAVIIYSKYTL
jgi:hypothetical protein